MHVKANLLLAVLSLIPLCGMGLWAQNLPDYGIVRIQAGQELTFGAFPAQIAEIDDNIIIQGTGWDTVNIFPRGIFYGLYDGNSINSLFFDTTNIESSNDGIQPSKSIEHDGLALIRRVTYRPIDPNLAFSAAGSILEYVWKPDSTFQVSHIDSMFVGPEDAEISRAILSSNVNQLDHSHLDTVQYVFTNGFNDKPGLVSYRSYLPDSIKGLRKTKTIELTEGIRNEDFQLKNFAIGDTLGRIILELNGGDNDFMLAYYNRHTGKLINKVFLRKNLTSIEGKAEISSKGIGYATSTDVDFDQPISKRVTTSLLAFDLRTAEELWEQSFTDSDGWQLGPNDELTRVDSSGNTVLVATTSSKRFDPSTRIDGFEDRTIIFAFDALTGDSLWTTNVKLDSFASPEHGLRPMDIAARPNGKGYVVANWVADAKLDPTRDLRYAYTALFFLDSLGCLAPGCRENSSTTSPDYNYTIHLSPNPVLAGQTVTVAVPQNLRRLRYTITNAQGQSIASGQLSALQGGAQVPTNGLHNGVYYLTVWPEEQGGAIVSKAFVVN